MLTECSVRQALAAFEQRSSPPGDGAAGLSAAAVGIVLVTGRRGTVNVLITRRSPNLRRHAAQWALPGGKVDPGESVPDAARRELAEELGYRLPQEAVLGRLDDYRTRSGFVISPVVLWGGPVRAGVELRPQRAEVGAVYGLTEEQLDVEPRFVTIPESDRPVIQLPMFGRHVHAPTAAVLYQFREVVLHLRGTRVAHFEQPVFAWR